MVTFIVQADLKFLRICKDKTYDITISKYCMNSFIINQLVIVF